MIPEKAIVRFGFEVMQDVHDDDGLSSFDFLDFSRSDICLETGGLYGVREVKVLPH
jgi:hypothetical protein